MKFDLKANEKPKIAKRPIDYSATSVRLRLVSLVAALGMVILAMNEASKPETWERLGFGNPSISEMSTAVESGTTIYQNHGQPILQNSPTSRWQKPLRSLDAGQIEILIASIDSRLSKIQLVEEPKRQAIRVLKKIRTQLDPEKDSDQIALVRNLQRRIETTDEVSISIDQLKELRSDVFSRSLEFVEDKSSMNRSVERVAWSETWKLSHSPEDKQEAEEVSYLQLAGQPTSYRGKRIKVRGEIRGIEKIKLPDNHELNIDAYFVLWIKPADANRTPYCIFTSFLPGKLADPGSQFVKVDNHEAWFEGRFFKLRTYEATNNRVEICPLIISNSVSIIERDRAVAKPAAWTPPNWLISMFMIVMPLVAAAMAFGVYRSTRTNKRVQLYNTAHDRKSLDQLKDLQGIHSEQEKIQQLYDSDATNN